VDGLRRIFNLSGMIEATMEANPESVTAELLEAARFAGINRLSLGVQSLSDVELSGVGRVHTAAEAIQAICLTGSLRQYRPSWQYSADVIRLTRTKLAIAMITLETLIGLDIHHLSLYCLSVEPHTAGSQSTTGFAIGGCPSRALCQCLLFVGNRGFVHYEISIYLPA
jgi:oxygen-independent coproporphyrinogen-3 oxidase